MANQNQTQAVQAATKKDIRAVITSMKDQIQAALPKHMSPERMIRVMLTTVNGNPKLLACTQESLLSALMKCSQYGLEPDGRHAHLIPYKDQCQLIFDYKGLVNLVRRSGDVTDIHCDVVYEKDDFEFSFGTGATLRHKPQLREQDRGEVTCAYSFVKLKDGSVSYEVMPWWEIEAVKENSQGYKAFKNGHTQSNPWDTNWNEMAKKTVFRRHSKWLPLSFEIQEKLNADDDRFDEEARFAKAKQAAGPLVATAAFLPEKTSDALPIDITEPPKPAAHDELRALLQENGFTADDFLKFAEQGGHIPAELGSLAEVSEETVKRLLRAKAGLLRGMAAIKEGAAA
jgi:recombination protein RecT